MSTSIEPTRPGRTRRAFLRHAAAATAALALSGIARSAPAPVGRNRPGGFLVLDNCDPDYQGKARYEDNLSFFDPAARLVARVGGLNNCEEIGSPHKIALDRKRGVVWVVENVGHRLLRFDLKGKKLGESANVKASALAVDPDTGNVWVTRSTGRIGEGSLEVFSPAGRSLASHDCRGWDIVYDGKGKVFWLAEKELLKVTRTGRVLARQTVTNWCPSSLAVNHKSGAVWVVTRHHSGRLGKNALLGLDGNARLLHTVELGTRTPFRVAVDSDTGAVWVTILRGSVLKYTAAGKPDGERKVQALAADVEPGTGSLWVATDEEVLKLDGRGKVAARARHKAKTTQAWVLGF
jgi:DNA-binding beta-propeller fold protein YncE